MATATGFQRIERGVLPAGAAGTRATLALMRRTALEGGRSMQVRAVAERVLHAAGVRVGDTWGELQAVFAFVRDRIRFTRDPVDLELLQAPARLLVTRAGDCDDKAMLMVALLRSIGHRAQLAFRAVGADPANPRRYSHVFVTAQVGSRRVALDPTWPGTPFGWQVSSTLRPMEIPA